jgi:uncharacterized transporter YbjL
MRNILLYTVIGSVLGMVTMHVSGIEKTFGNGFIVGIITTLIVVVIDHKFIQKEEK